MVCDVLLLPTFVFGWFCSKAVFPLTALRNFKCLCASVQTTKIDVFVRCVLYYFERYKKKILLLVASLVYFYCNQIGPEFLCACSIQFKCWWFLFEFWDNWQRIIKNCRVRRENWRKCNTSERLITISLLPLQVFDFKCISMRVLAWIIK